MTASTWPDISDGDSDQFTLTISTSSGATPLWVRMAPSIASSTPPTEKPTFLPARSVGDLIGPSASASRQFSGVATSVPTRRLYNAYRRKLRGGEDYEKDLDIMERTAQFQGQFKMKKNDGVMFTQLIDQNQQMIEKYEGEKGVLNFYVFRKDLKQVWRIKDTSLTKERLREARGRNIVKGEKFYHIPYTEAELINVA